MEQRRKIIVPTGAETDETLSTPHFDAEATLSARPVVPLTEAVEPPARDIYSESHAAAYAPSVASSSWKRSTLILIILAAVCVGIASGLAIGLYQSSRKAPAAQIVEQPSASEPQQQATTQPEPMQPVLVNQTEPEPEEEISVPTSDKETDDAAETKNSTETKNNSSDDEPERANKPVARDNPKRDEERVPPTVVRDRQPDDVVRDERDERMERRERRREERREERRAERRRQREESAGAPLEVPRNIERARQEINRIRDIFEGRQP